MRREDIRRENARILASGNGGLAEFGRRLEMSNSQVSQIIGKTPSKNIGNSIAPRIEDAYGVARGWLDTPHNQQGTLEPDDSAKPTTEHASGSMLARLSPRELALLEKYRMSDSAGKTLIETVSDHTKKLSVDDVLRNQEQSGA